jgi:pyrroline-5-carboxylate reductase
VVSDNTKSVTIVGNGKMATAILQGCLSGGYKVKVVARNQEKLDALFQKFGVDTFCFENEKFDIENQDVILCVKPNVIKEVSKKLVGKAKSIISVLAGTKTETLQTTFNAQYYLRAMPNIAALYQKSMTTLIGDKSYKNEALDICSSFGKTLWLDSEKELDIATALAGSGPAFLSVVSESLIDAAVMNGLKREYATTLTKGLFDGFKTLLENKSSSTIKEEVMSPAGTTAKGLEALEKNGVRSGFIEAVTKAYEKAVAT